MGGRFRFVTLAGFYSVSFGMFELASGDFAEISQFSSGGTSSTTALKGSTESEQFH